MTELEQLVEHGKSEGIRSHGSVACEASGCREPVASYFLFRDRYPFVMHFCKTHGRMFSLMMSYGLTEQQATDRA